MHLSIIAFPVVVAIAREEYVDKSFHICNNTHIHSHVVTHFMNTTTTKETVRRSGVLGNILAIFVFLVVIGIGIWGAVTAFRLAPSMFSLIRSPFSASETLTITAPTASVIEGDKFSLTWEYAPAREDGIFSFIYNCVPGFTFEAPVAEGGVYGALTCNIPYGVPGTERGIRLIGTVASSSTAIVPVTVSYTTVDGTTQATATTSIEITATATTKTTETTPTSVEPEPRATVHTPTPSVPSYADLVIHTQSVTTDPYTNFTIVRFEVQNIGTAASGVWYFSAHLPTFDGYAYTSPTQASLNPLDGVVFTLTFDQSAGGTLSITADPDGLVPESNNGNNTLQEFIGGGYSPVYPYSTYQDEPYYYGY